MARNYLTKHIDEREYYAMDFSNQREVGETLSSIDALEVRRNGTDLTANFRTDGDNDPAIVAGDVRFWLSPTEDEGPV